MVSICRTDIGLRHYPNVIRYTCLSALVALHAAAGAQEKMRSDSLKNIDLLPAVAVAGLPRLDGVVSLDRRTLDVVQGRTLGETLSRVPGVQQSYYGPNSGAPVVRSMSGNRVKVLADGVAYHDLSGISPNLNINVDMDNLAEVEVYKTGASVRYGGKAIGGAVNTKDNTIPGERFARRFQGRVRVEGGTNSGHRQAVDLNGNLGDRWAWHIGGMNQQHGDLKIPGNTKAPLAYDPAIDQLTQVLAQVHVDAETTRNLTLYPYISQFVLDHMHDPRWGLSEADLYTFQAYSVIDGVEIPNPKNELFVPGQDPNTPFYTTVVKGIYDYVPVTRGIMPNSHADSRSVNLGTSYIGEDLRVGVGYRALEGYYGVPGFAMATKQGHTHGAAMPAPAYAPINTRALSHSVLLHAAFVPTSRAVESLRLHYVTQYADDRELVGIYRVNKINSNRHALRAEVEQRALRFWRGMSGADFSYLKMRGDGVQRYLPDNLSREWGVFTRQQVELDRLALGLGYRHDWVARRAMPDPGYKTSRGLAGGKLSGRNFGLHHFSADLQWKVWKMAFVKGSYSHAERAPEVNELYAGNDHFAIMLEENGDDRLPKEVARTYEVGGGLQGDTWRLTATYYHTMFEDYLYLAHTGLSRSGGFLVKEWRASDTEITGWEAEAAHRWSWGERGALEVASFFDLVKNKNTSDDRMRKWAEGDFMPNLPTSRYGVSVAVQVDGWRINGSFDRYLKQRYLGKNINPEPPMPPYSMLAARIAHPFRIIGYVAECYVSGNNLLDAEARPQNSFLKYLAPLPGRNLSLGVNVLL